MRPSSAALLAACCLSCLTASRCASPSAQGGSKLTIVAYNVKSLFDEVDNGTEFPEFSVAKGKWDAARYKLRLENVAAAVLAAAPSGSKPPGPDVLCLEEIENAKVLEALRAGPLASARYRYAAIAPSEGGPFSVCALSRVPILSSRCHSVALPSGRAGRDILEMELEVGSRRLVVIACHWKSKSGGDEATEEARREAAALVRSRVEALISADAGAEVIVCGDLNESPDEYARRGRRYPTALIQVEDGSASAGSPKGGARGGRPSRLLVSSSKALAGMRDGREIVLFSPWDESGGYSFSFRGSRERLDNFLLSPALLDGKGLEYMRFSAEPAHFLVDGEGTPIAWPGSGATGYSDHLPILLVLGSGGGG
jgi:endonuclease/exonuclease/phosphatase family metal-dependent hydrolase